jgi:hypothetical protein
MIWRTAMNHPDQQPAPDARSMAQTPPTPQTPLAPDAVLAEQLAQCHKAIAECFVCGSDNRLPLSMQFEAVTVAERLMRVSIALAQALGKSPREFTHRIIVERPAPMIDVTPERTEDPPPPRPKSKTIHSGREPRVYNIG